MKKNIKEEFFSGRRFMRLFLYQIQA